MNNLSLLLFFCKYLLRGSDIQAASPNNMEATFANINTSIRGVFNSDTPYEMVPLIDWDTLATRTGRASRNDILFNPESQRADVKAYDYGNAAWAPDGGRWKIPLKQKWTDFDSIHFVFRYGGYFVNRLIPVWQLKFDLNLTNTFNLYGLGNGIFVSIHAMARDKTKWNVNALTTEDAFYIENTNANIIDFYGIRYTKQDITK